MSDSPKNTVAYVLKRFPRISETFILEEMLGLERSGVRLVVYAIGDPREAFIDPDVLQLRAPVIYLTKGAKSAWSPFVERARYLGDHLRLALLSPTRYVKALRVAFSSLHPGGSLKNIAYGSRIARDLEGRNVAHVHAGFVHSPASAGLIAAQFLGLTFSMAGHAKDIYSSTPLSLARKLSGARFVLCCSTRAYDEVIAKVEGLVPSGDLAKVHLIHHGVDSARFCPDGEVRAAGAVKFLAVGRLVEKKGFADLLRAFAVLCQANGNASLRFVGDGPLRKSLEKLALELGVDSRVKFLGSLKRDAVLKELREADVFVHPSVVLANGDQDGIPNVVLEAMACGLPVVGADIEGIREVIRSYQNGIVAKSGDVAALASAMEQLAQSSSLRSELSLAARASVVASFSKDNAIALVSQMIRSVLPGEPQREERPPSEVVA